MALLTYLPKNPLNIGLYLFHDISACESLWEPDTLYFWRLQVVCSFEK